MYSEQPVPKRFPKVPIERRAAAFLIDFVTVWLLSSFFGIGVIRWIIFVLLWLGLRVFFVSSNKGQSFGQWALDMKLLELRFRKIPDLLTLAKREGIVGAGALLASIGLNINISNALSMVLLCAPLLVDFGIAASDREWQQAYHDRLAGTVVIQTQRGFSLDLRAKRWLVEIRDRMRR
ncbi:MAG: RDD family protein [Oscillatoria sp. PMC 1068.18]|nr:RDD family protein [Oscillatoria sp. PMC 1076.18]MEC4987663.1 RDD family protein [Oscillatoria sp. PMC 1068.18]